MIVAVDGSQAGHAELAERAADAWEAANAWQLEPDYALRRLRRLMSRA